MEPSRPLTANTPGTATVEPSALGSQPLYPQFLRPLGAEPLTVNDPRLFFPEGVPGYEPVTNPYVASPFFPEIPKAEIVASAPATASQLPTLPARLPELPDFIPQAEGLQTATVQQELPSSGPPEFPGSLVPIALDASEAPLSATFTTPETLLPAVPDASSSTIQIPERTEPTTQLPEIPVPTTVERTEKIEAQQEPGTSENEASTENLVDIPEVFVQPLQEENLERQASPEIAQQKPTAATPQPQSMVLSEQTPESVQTSIFAHAGDQTFEALAPVLPREDISEPVSEVVTNEVSEDAGLPEVAPSEDAGLVPDVSLVNSEAIPRTPATILTENTVVFPEQAVDNLAILPELSPGNSVIASEPLSAENPEVSSQPTSEAMSTESPEISPETVPPENLEAPSEVVLAVIPSALEASEGFTAPPEQTPEVRTENAVASESVSIPPEQIPEIESVPAPSGQTVIPATPEALSTDISEQFPDSSIAESPETEQGIPTISTVQPAATPAENVTIPPAAAEILSEAFTFQEPIPVEGVPQTVIQVEPDEEQAPDAEIQEQAQALQAALANRLVQLEAESDVLPAVAETQSETPEEIQQTVAETQLETPEIQPTVPQQLETQAPLEELPSTVPLATGEAPKEEPQTQVRQVVQPSAAQAVQLPVLSEEPLAEELPEEAEFPTIETSSESAPPASLNREALVPDIEDAQISDLSTQPDAIQEKEETPLFPFIDLGISPFLPTVIENLSTLTPDPDPLPTPAIFQNLTPLTFAQPPQSPVGSENLPPPTTIPEQPPGTSQPQVPAESQTVELLADQIGSLDIQTQELEPSLETETAFPPAMMVGTPADQENIAFLGTMLAAAQPLGNSALDGLVYMPEARQFEILAALPLAYRPELLAESSPTQQLSTVGPPSRFMDGGEKPAEPEHILEQQTSYAQATTPLEFASPQTTTSLQIFDQIIPASPTPGYSQSTQPLVYRPIPTSQQPSSLADSTRPSIDQSGIEELLSLDSDNNYQAPEPPSFEDESFSEENDTTVSQLFRQGIEKGPPQHKATVQEPEQESSPTYMMEAPKQDDNDDDEGDSDDGVDLEGLARQIYHLVRHRLDREKERHGGHQDRGGW